MNRHWKSGFGYNFPKKRALYSELIPALHQKYLLSVVGIRRTGKTTLMKQLIDELIEKKVPCENILFYTFDEPAEFQEVIDEYLKISSKNLEREKLYFFLDEIQKLEDWQNKIKIYYDHYPNIKIFVSGSSSLFIRKKSESLAGRIREFNLPPLSFREYLFFKGKEELLQKKPMFSSELRRELEIYASRQFIEIIEETEDVAKEYLNTLARKVIFEDIPQVYPLEQPQVLWKLFKIIAQNPGMLLDYHSLSSDLGINEKTLSNYSEFLEKAFLLKKLYNYSPNQLTSEKKLKKVYPSASSFCETDVTKIMETVVVTQLPCNFFWRRTQEVDGILILDGKAVPLEIKYKNNFRAKDLTGIKKFVEEFNTEKGIILTKDEDKKEGKLHFIPAWKFLAEYEENLPELRTG